MIRIFSVLSILFFTNVVFSQYSQTYELDKKREYSIYGIGLGLSASGLLFNKQAITPEELELLDENNLNALDRSTVFNYNLKSAAASDIFEYVSSALPFTILLTKPGKEEWKTILVIISETAILNTSTTIFTKEAIDRARPYAYNENLSIAERTIGAANKSFLSGHTSHVASMTFLTASMYADLFPESNKKWMFWTGAATVSAITGYLRHDAGKHFPTDVITSFFSGAAIGYFVPKLHRVSDRQISILPAFGNNALSLNCTFILD